jgi:hypothetical protein
VIVGSAIVTAVAVATRRVVTVAARSGGGLLALLVEQTRARVIAVRGDAADPEGKSSPESSS